MRGNKSVVIFGGSFNPPGEHHTEIVKNLVRHFDKVVVVPCGIRPDKLSVNWIEPFHRAAMTDLAFGKMRNVEVDLSDIEHGEYTRTWELSQKYQGKYGDDVWIMVGSDLVRGGKNGESLIQTEWEHGREIWKNLNFAVFRRMNYEIEESDLPPHSRVFEAGCGGSITEIRDMIFNGESINGSVVSGVEDYIARHELYQRRPPAQFMEVCLKEPRLLIVADNKNTTAKRAVPYFSSLANRAHPNLILVIGGDGKMLRAIRRYWRLRLPFFGVNVGHNGFLLNDLEGVMEAGPLLSRNLVVRHLPLLYSEFERVSGEKVSSFAVNDVWLERDKGQAAWLEVRVDDKICLPRLVGDGILIATAAGSTAYARAMGATPLLIGTPALLLVGSNILEPNWKSAHLAIDSSVEFINLAPEKRPVLGFADGICYGRIKGARVRTSYAAAAELAFLPEHDLAAKLAQIQFPQL